MIVVRRLVFVSGLVLAATLVAGRVVLASLQGQPGDTAGWQIPAGAAAEVNPVEATPAVLAKGKEIYKAKCQRCHGPKGTGNGPDADEDHPPGDLTNAKRASRNPDGVMFYKIWNGRKNPKMPAQKTELTKQDVWTVIQYAKTLRRPAATQDQAPGARP